MARILVVYTNTYQLIAPAPLGASLVAARLRRDGHSVHLLDLMFASSPAAEAARTARALRPDLVCFSVRNVDNQSCVQFYDPIPDVRAIVSAVREVCDAPFLAGGTAFTSFPTQLMKALGVDYGIAGDDLEPISGFVASLLDGNPDLATPGLVFRRGEEVRCNPFEIRGYAGTAFDGWDLLGIGTYRRSFKTYWEAGVVARTGCPFQCVFCDTYRTFGREWVLRDPHQVAAEVMEVQRRGARSIFMADAGFNRPLDHAKAVLEAIIAAGSRAMLTAVFEPGEVDAEFARLYRRAGGRIMMIFATSLSESILAAGRKPFQLQDVLGGSDLLREAGITNMLFLGFGGPGETPATVEETLGRVGYVKPAYSMVDHGFRIQPGTRLREIAVAEGAVSAEDDCFKATFYHSPDTPPEMLEARLKGFRSEHGGGRQMLPLMARVMWNKLRP